MSYKSINSSKSSPEKPKPKPEHLVISGRTLAPLLTGSLFGTVSRMLGQKQLQEFTVIGGDADDNICKGVGEMTFLKKLSINECRLSGVGAMQLLSLSQLIELNLDDNPTIKNGYPSVTVKAFSSILVKFRKLQLFKMKIYCANRLFLTNENITDRQIRFIGENLKNLIGITLDNNNIGITGAKIIGKNLYYLTFLDLNNNSITDEGAVHITRGCPELTILWLNRNRIGPEGINRIANRLSKLQTLGINFNDVRPRGIEQIWARLRNMEELYVGVTSNWEHMLPQASLKRLKQQLHSTKIVQELEGRYFSQRTET